MKARMWVERTVIDTERETNTGIGNPCSVSSRAVPSPLSHRSRSASTTYVARSHKQARTHGLIINLIHTLCARWCDFGSDIWCEHNGSHFSIGNAACGLSRPRAPPRRRGDAASCKRDTHIRSLVAVAATGTSCGWHRIMPFPPRL